MHNIDRLLQNYISSDPKLYLLETIRIEPLICKDLHIKNLNNYVCVILIFHGCIIDNDKCSLMQDKRRSTRI